MFRFRNIHIDHGAVSAIAFLLVGLVILHSTGCSPEPEFSGSDELFHDNARIAWVRQIGGEEGNDPFCIGENLVLMGRDRSGERRILPEEGNYRKPLITPDGEGLVFSSHTERAFYYVNWDGSSLRKLGNGSAIETWADPAGCIWVYYMDGDLAPTLFNGKRVKRCRLEDPSITELIWEKTAVSSDNFQLSADGTKAAGLFPWTQVGIADLPSQTLCLKGKGCWTSMSPDNRYLMWYFDGAHKKLVMRSFDGSIRSKVRINTMPEAQRHEVYHPRWSNHPRFFAMTGPYRQMGEYNAITGGGEGINLYVGKFDPNYKRVERWYQVTDHAHADFYPDLWMDNAPAASDTGTSPSRETLPQELAAKWPANRDGLIYIWRDGKSINGIESSEIGYHRCSAVRKGKAQYGRFHEMLLSQGYFTADGTDGPLTDAVQKTQSFTVMLNLRPALKQAPESGVVMAKGNMELRQEDKMLILKAEGHPEFKLQELEPEQDYFIALTYDVKSGLQFYHQGRVTLIQTEPLTFHEFGSRSLTFGGLADGSKNWKGAIDGVAWYARALSAEDVIGEHAAYVASLSEGRDKAAPRLVVEARLIEASPMPTPKGIAPYRSALVEYLYEIERVEEGRVSEKQLIVQHWVILDAVAYPLNREIGQTYRLVLESIEDHPELEGERISSELIEPVDIYLDVAE